MDNHPAGSTGNVGDLDGAHENNEYEYTEAYKKHLNNECSTHCPYCEDDDEIGWLI